MARVERATSRGNKSYITSKVVTFDEVEANFIKTNEMTFDKISGGTATLGGADNGNGVLEVKNSSGTTQVKINNEGITMADNTKIIGGNGVLSTYFFPLRTLDGYYDYLGWYYDGDTYFEKIIVGGGVIIPSNFTIATASLLLRGEKTEWFENYEDVTSLGYATANNVKLYKSTSRNYKYIIGGGTKHSFSETNTNVLGANGVTIGGSSGTEHIVNIDISNFSTGFNLFFLQSDMAHPNPPSLPSRTSADVHEEVVLTDVKCMAGIQITGYLK